MALNHIFVIGTGELGHALLTSIHTHSSYTTRYTLTTTIRPSTLSHPSTARQTQLDTYKSQNITILPLDIESSSLQSLTDTLSPYTTIIHAGGMTLSSETQLKLTRAVLASSSHESQSNPNQRKLYIPWQFGLDYDAIGPSSGSGLFAEQCAVRSLLRDQNHMDWVIVSNGIFTSFLFEPVWGVVHRHHDHEVNDDDDDEQGESIMVRALGSWDAQRLVATTAEGIARCTAELLLVDHRVRNGPVYIAGDVFTYDELAEMVERASGKTVKRELWDTPMLEARMDAEPGDKLARYHVVFSKGVGTAWDVTQAYNAQKGIELEGVEQWLDRNRHVLQ